MQKSIVDTITEIFTKKEINWVIKWFISGRAYY